MGILNSLKKTQKYSKANTKFVQEQATITNGLTRDAEFEHLLKTESTADFVGKRVNYIVKSLIELNETLHGI